MPSELVQRSNIANMLSQVPAWEGVELRRMADPAGWYLLLGDEAVPIPSGLEEYSQTELFDLVADRVDMLHMACAPAAPDGPPLVGA